MQIYLCETYVLPIDDHPIFKSTVIIFFKDQWKAQNHATCATVLGQILGRSLLSPREDFNC